jgi:hyperosmotically inducible periplasmic protein
MTREFHRKIALAASLCVITPAARPQSQRTAVEQRAPEKNLDPLARQVRHQLAVLPFSSVFDYVTFTLDGNKVTLQGRVLRPTLREHAEAAVGSIEGVGAVVNRIEVLPVSAADDELRRAVYRAIYEDAVLQRYAVETIPTIHILVSNGSVILEGFVEVEADKQRAAARTNAVAGVANLQNNLQVRPKENAHH